MKKLCCLLLFFLVADIGKTADPPTQIPLKSKCNLKLVQSFGFKGVGEPSDYKMIMCPDIKKSCCRMSDQVKIYEYSELSGEKQELQERLASYRQIYDDILDVSIEVEEKAKFLIQKLKNKLFSNCKVLGKKLLEFQAEKVTVELKKAIDDIYTFLETSYNGFYCSVCDYRFQTAFNEVDRKAKIDKKFCRKMIHKSLIFMLYSEVHLANFLNLQHRFLTYCNVSGKFVNESIDPDLLIKVDPEQEEKVKACRENRNHHEWLKHCRPICDGFNLLKITPLQKPHLDKYRKTNENLRRLLALFEIPRESDEESETFEMKPHKKTLQRINGDLNEEEIEKLREKHFGSPFVIKTQGIDSLSVESFTNSYSKSKHALNLYDVGKQVQVNKRNLATVESDARGEMVIDTPNGPKVIYPILDAREEEKKKAKENKEKEMAKETKIKLVESNAILKVTSLILLFSIL